MVASSSSRSPGQLPVELDAVGAERAAAEVGRHVDARAAASRRSGGRCRSSGAGRTGERDDGRRRPACSAGSTSRAGRCPARAHRGPRRARCRCSTVAARPSGSSVVGPASDHDLDAWPSARRVGSPGGAARRWRRPASAAGRRPTPGCAAAGTRRPAGFRAGSSPCSSATGSAAPGHGRIEDAHDEVRLRRRQRVRHGVRHHRGGGEVDVDVGRADGDDAVQRQRPQRARTRRARSASPEPSAAAASGVIERERVPRQHRAVVGPDDATLDGPASPRRARRRARRPRHHRPRRARRAAPAAWSRRRSRRGTAPAGSPPSTSARPGPGR